MFMSMLVSYDSLRNYDLDFHNIYLALYDPCCVGAQTNIKTQTKHNFLSVSQYEKDTETRKEEQIVKVKSLLV